MGNHLHDNNGKFLKLRCNPQTINLNYCAHGKMAKVIIMMVTRHEYIVGIYFSIIPPWRAGGGRIYTLHNIHVEFPLSWGPFYGLKGAEDQRACKPGGYLPIKRLTIFPTIYVWRPAALTFGRTLSVSQSTWIQQRKIWSKNEVLFMAWGVPKIKEPVSRVDIYQ